MEAPAVASTSPSTALACTAPCRRRRATARRAAGRATVWKGGRIDHSYYRLAKCRVSIYDDVRQIDPEGPIDM